MIKPKLFISKSKFLAGLQCLKLLWYQYNDKAKIPEPDQEAKERMKQGIIVGQLAQKLYPQGITIARDNNPLETAQRSMAALSSRQPLFEAGFVYESGYALPDILEPVGQDAWDLIEVKSTSSVKEEHLLDAAFQKYVYQGSGLKINKVFIQHLNKAYKKNGDLDLNKLFIKEDVTSKIKDLLPDLGDKLAAMAKIISAELPQINADKHCAKDCPLFSLCWSFLPQENVFLLRGRRKKALDLIEQGILQLADIPSSIELDEKQAIQVKCHNSGKAYIDQEAVNNFLSELKYPLYFLDFETIATAIPIYDLSGPHEPIPFQFSLHVIEKAGAQPKHYSFLAPGDIDPRPDLLKQLQELLGNQGSIIIYNAVYEKICLRNAIKAYPAYAKWLKEIEIRIVDLLLPFRNFAYYHPAQKGSASIKYVLPALTGISYNDLEIGGGGAARFEYMRVALEEKVPEKEKQRVFKLLEQYCELDTRGMIEIGNFLKMSIQGFQ